jgi:predicted AAA+ superfamily ATPase
MLIGNFTPLDNRNDKGAIWENFLITERIKNLNYQGSLANSYFWRTKQQQEIDYVEENSGTITGYEFKWNPKAKTKIHKSFVETYNSTIEVINKENFRDFLG